MLIRMLIRMSYWLYAARPLPRHGVNAYRDADRTGAVLPGQRALVSCNAPGQRADPHQLVVPEWVAQKCSQVRRLRSLAYSRPWLRRLTIVAASIAVQTAPWCGRQPSSTCSVPASCRRHVIICTSAPELLMGGMAR